MDVFDGITPGFGPFAGVFSKWTGILIALVWAAAFVYVAVHLVLAVASLAASRRRHRPDPESSGWNIAWPIGALIGLTLVPVIYSTLVAA